MSKLVWDDVGKRIFETGLEMGVLYPRDATGAYPLGVAWNGLTGVTESPSGAEATPFYADNIKYANLMSNEDFGATVEAFYYPDEFAECNGEVEIAPGVIAGQQTRKVFGLCYRTKVGNDVAGQDYGYKLHLVYGALASPAEKAYGTINESPELNTFSWEITTTPVPVPGFKPSAHLEIDSTKLDAAGLVKLAALEEILYGKDATTDPVAEAVDPRLPLPTEIATLMAAA